MRGKSRSRSNPRSSKRKNELETCSSEPKSKRIIKKNDNEQKVDKYCWLCHSKSNDKICVTCHRVYDISCLEKAKASFSDLGACPECQFPSVSGVPLNSNKYFSLDKLKKMLDALTRRSFKKKIEKKEIFLRWPEEKRDKLFKIIDSEILLDNINHVLPYTRTAEFYSDVKFIYHNACIAYGANSDQAKAAENLRKDFMAELLDLEACPECYYFLYCEVNPDCPDRFVRLCAQPHDIVWAQLTGHPYWPAKSLKVVKGMAHVRFFGEHEQSNISISKCFYMSDNHPTVKTPKPNNLLNSGPKSQRYKSAMGELLEYIKLYRQKYGEFDFRGHKKPFKPDEKQNEVVESSTEGSCNRSLAEMKLEGNVNEDAEMGVINLTSVVDDSEGNWSNQNGLTNDIPAPDGSGTTGQFPHLAHINPSMNLSGSPCEGSVADQYSTFAQYDPFVNPRLGPGQDGLNMNLSAVKSINMTFAADENNTHPDVASIGSLPLTNAASIGSLPLTNAACNVHSSPPLSEVACNITNIEKFKGREMLPSGPEGTDTVRSITVTNIASNSCIIQPDSLHNNVTEVEDEVHIIGQGRDDAANGSINPDVVLPVLMEGDSELRSIVQKNRYMSDAIIVELYANFRNNANNLGKISKLCVDLRKCRSEMRKALDEIDKLRKEDEINKSTIQSLNDTVIRLEKVNEELQINYEHEQNNNVLAAVNAREVILNIKAEFTDKIEESYKNTVNEKEKIIEKRDKQLQAAEEELKNLEEQNRCLKKEIEEMKVEKQKVEDELKTAKRQISPDTISEYKRTHYCCVCERSAAKTCCLDTSYCSLECEERHAEEHRKNCRNKITSQSFVQQRVIRQQSVVMVSHGNYTQGVINPGMAPLNNPSVSQAEHVPSPSSPLLPTPHDHRSTSSFHSFSSKNKRRANR